MSSAVIAMSEGGMASRIVFPHVKNGRCTRVTIAGGTGMGSRSPC